jgi:hypothetical protein
MVEFKVGDTVVCVTKGPQSVVDVHYRVVEAYEGRSYDGTQRIRVVVNGMSGATGYNTTAKRFALVSGDIECVKLDENFNLIGGKLDEEDLIVIRDHIRGAA